MEGKGLGTLWPTPRLEEGASGLQDMTPLRANCCHSSPPQSPPTREWGQLLAQQPVKTRGSQGGRRVALPGEAGVPEVPQMVTNSKRLPSCHILELLAPV